jgi:hypothetical protein
MATTITAIPQTIPFPRNDLLKIRSGGNPSFQSRSSNTAFNSRQQEFRSKMHEVIRDSDPSVYTTSSRRIIPSPGNCSPIISDWRDRNPPPDGIVRDGLRNLHFHLASLSENTLRRYQRDLRIAMRDLLPGVAPLPFRPPPLPV